MIPIRQLIEDLEQAERDGYEYVTQLSLRDDSKKIEIQVGTAIFSATYVKSP